MCIPLYTVQSTVFAMVRTVSVFGCTVIDTVQSTVFAMVLYVYPVVHCTNSTVYYYSPGARFTKKTYN